MRHLLCLLLAVLAPCGWAQNADSSAPTASTPDFDTLRRSLPADWTLQRQREPIFNSLVTTAEAGQANPTPLLFVHGLGDGGMTDWLPTMKALASRYHVIALDLPGFGRSESPLGKYSPSRYAEVLSWLLTKTGKGPAIVAGHSMGGAVALRFSHVHPEQVSRLILVDAAGILHRTAFVKHSATLPLSVEASPEPLKPSIASLRNFGGVLVEKVLGIPLDPTDLLRRSDLAWSVLLRSRSNINAAMGMIDEDFSQAVFETRTPTWIIWGEADTVTPLRTGQMLAARLPRATLASIPGATHTPMISATSRFMPLFERALGAADSEVPAVTPGPAPSTKPGTLRCSGETGKLYSGTWREIIIEGCTAVRLVDVQADRIVLRDAIVEMTRVSVRGEKYALEVTNGDLRATASDFSAATAIVADGARLDFAGVRMRATHDILQARRHTRLIASVSQVDRPGWQGYLHTSVELTDTTLRPDTPATPDKQP